MIRNFICTVLLALGSMLFLSVNAQTDLKFMGGLGLSFGTGPETVGLQFRGDVDITEEWSGGVNFITYFKSDFTWWELNFDGRYLFPITDDLKLYPMAGLNLSTAGASVNVPGFGNFGAKTTKVGLNIGGGARYAVAERISLIGEIKYIISNFDQLVITVGAVYHF